jgi:hypothetical protein
LGWLGLADFPWSWPNDGTRLEDSNKIVATAKARMCLPSEIKSELGAFSPDRFPVRTAKEKRKFLQIGPVLPRCLQIPDVIFRPLFPVVKVALKGVRRQEPLPILHRLFGAFLVRHGPHLVYANDPAELRALGCMVRTPFYSCGLALQLLLWEMSESMGNHDSEVVDASSVD